VHGWILDTYLAEKVAGTPQPLDPPAWERLDDLRVPLLVMVGTVDDPGTRDSMRQLASRVAWAQLEVFDGAAHMLNLEQPERFNRVLRQFLDEVSARTG
jgi:pimeloyl-ACP methyl ester carboxylesterase